MEFKPKEEVIVVTQTGYELATYKKKLDEWRNVVKIRSGVLTGYDIVILNKDLLKYSLVTTHRLQKEFGYLKQFSTDF
jgi:hypothetical protein